MEEILNNLWESNTELLEKTAANVGMSTKTNEDRLTTVLLCSIFGEEPLNIDPNDLYILRKNMKNLVQSGFVDGEIKTPYTQDQILEYM